MAQSTLPKEMPSPNDIDDDNDEDSDMNIMDDHIQTNVP